VIAVQAHGRLLALRRFSARSGRRWVPALRLTRRGRALLRRHTSLRASLVVENRDRAGMKTTTSQTIRITA
jgi:hypothetical protein